VRKPRAQVEAEIEDFLRFYPDIQGFHLDEQSSNARDIAYYAALSAFIHKRIPGGLVLSNPGTVCAEGYVQDSSLDAVCMFERESGLAQFQMPAWASKYSHSRFCVQQYQVSTAVEMNELLSRAIKLGVGYVFLTDRRGPNPYDRLPTYWEEEVEVVQRINVRGKN
jgi:hypothetical protein